MLLSPWIQYEYNKVDNVKEILGKQDMLTIWVAGLDIKLRYVGDFTHFFVAYSCSPCVKSNGKTTAKFN